MARDRMAQRLDKTVLLPEAHFILDRWPAYTSSAHRKGQNLPRDGVAFFCGAAIDADQKPKPSRWPAYTSSAHRKGQNHPPRRGSFFLWGGDRRGCSKLQAWPKTVGPSPSICSLSRMPGRPWQDRRERGLADLKRIAPQVARMRPA